MALVKFYKVAFTKDHKDVINKAISQAYLNACEVVTSLTTSRFIRPQDSSITLRGNVVDVTAPAFNYISFTVGARTFYAFVTGFSINNELELEVSFEIDNYMTYTTPELVGDLIKSQYFAVENVRPYIAPEIETGNNSAVIKPFEPSGKWAFVVCVVPSSEAPESVPSPFYFALYEKDFVNTPTWLTAYSSLMNSSTMRVKTGSNTFKEFGFTYSKAFLVPDSLLISVQASDFYGVKLSDSDTWQNVSSISNGNTQTYFVHTDYHKKQSIGVFTRRVPVPFVGYQTESFTITAYTGNSANIGSLNGNFAIVLEFGETVLDITNEFNVSISQSSFSQYLAQNGTTLAVNSLSSIVGGIIAGAGGGVVGALAGGGNALLSQGFSLVTQIISARKQSDTVHCSGDFAGLVNYKSHGICLFETEAENSDQIDAETAEKGFDGYFHTDAIPLVREANLSPSRYYQQYTNLRTILSGSPYDSSILEMYERGVNVWNFPLNYTPEQFRAWRPKD